MVLPFLRSLHCGATLLEASAARSDTEPPATVTVLEWKARTFVTFPTRTSILFVPKTLAPE